MVIVASFTFLTILNYEIPSVRWNRIITRAVKQSKEITFVIISYRENTRKVNSMEGIVHITSQTIKPVFNARNLVVTVHDIMASQGNIKADSIEESLKKIYMNRYLKAYMNYENISYAYFPTPVIVESSVIYVTTQVHLKR